MYSCKFVDLRISSVQLFYIPGTLRQIPAKRKKQTTENVCFGLRTTTFKVIITI